MTGWQLTALSSTAAMLFSSTAMAFPFQINDEIKGTFDTVFSYGVQKRMSGVNCHIVSTDSGGCASEHGKLADSSSDASFINSDDGDLNYNKHDIVSSIIKGTHDLFLERESTGTSALLRYSEQYDFKANDTRRTNLSSGGRDMAVSDHRMLDAWVGQKFNWFGQDAHIKVGQQAVAWGEGLFTPGGVNIINAIDVRRAHTPGTQLKEVFRPAPMILLSSDISEKASIETYYQWKWNAFELDAPGSYWSGADPVGHGASRSLYVPTSAVNQGIRDALPPYSEKLIGQAPIGTMGDPGSTGLTRTQLQDPTVMVPRLANGLHRPVWLTGLAYGVHGGALPYLKTNKGSNSGQWGVAFRYLPEWYNGGSFRFYYVRFNEKIPTLSYHVSPSLARANPVSAGYSIDYANNREMFGISTSTAVGNWGVGAELAYQPKQMVSIDPSVPVLNSKTANKRAEKYACVNGGGEAAGRYCKGWVDEKKLQATINALQVLQPSEGLGRYLLGPLGASEGQFLLEVSATDMPGMHVNGGIPYSLPGYALPDKFSWGYTLSTFVTYPNVGGFGWNVSPEIDINHGVHGNSPNAVPWMSHTLAVTYSVNLKNTAGNMTHGVGYTSYTGGKDYNLVSDRDFLSYVFTYTF